MTTPNKVLDQPAYNSNVNTWGTGPLNTNFGYIDLALGGSTLLNATGLGGTTVALSAAQCIPLSLVVSGTPGGITTYTIPAGTGGQWVVRNGTSGGYGVRVQSAAGGTYVTVNAGDNVQVSCDGTSSGMVRNDTTASAGGSTTQVQYNNAGVLAGSANMTFNGTILTAHTLDASTGGVIYPDNTTQTTAAVTAPAGSTTQVQFNDGGVFAGDAGLTFNKTTNDLTVGGLLTAAGATLSSTLTMTAAAINGAIRVDVASATTCAIGAAVSNYVRITGTTTITGLGTVASGVYRDVVFAGILTLTHNATSLILQTGANITTAAGDTAGFISEGSGNWRCLYYQRASGLAVAAPRGYVATNSTGYALSSSFSSPMTITEGTQLFSTTYTGGTNNTVLVTVDVVNCSGQGVIQALSIFKDGATNAVATSVIQITNLAFMRIVNRSVYSFVASGAAALQVRVAGSGDIGNAVLSISEFGA
jgi:hypothetical protein